MRSFLRCVVVSLVLAGMPLVPGPTAHAHAPHDPVTDLVVSPDYGADGVVFTTARGNLLRSTDEGTTWSQIVRGLDHPGVLQLAVAPSAKQTMFMALAGGGVYRSVDQGWSWQSTANLSTMRDIADIAVSPKNPSVVFAAGQTTRLFRTNNAGGSWVTVGSFGKVNSLLYPTQGGRILVGTEAGSVAISDDNGSSWTNASGLPTADAITALGTIPVPATGAPVFAGTRSGRLFRSVDRGTTFTEVGGGLPDEPITSVAASDAYATDRTVWMTARASGVYRSVDAGATFVAKCNGCTTNAQADEIGKPDFSSVIAAGKTGAKRALFLAAFTGTFVSNDNGDHWRELQTQADQVVGLAISPSYASDSTVIATTYVKGAYVSRNRGAQWTDAHVGLSQAGGTEFSPLPRLHNVVFSPDYEHDGTIFTSTTTRIARSTDRGVSWATFPVGTLAAGQQSRFVIATSPVAGGGYTVFLGSETGELWQSTARGAPGSWSLRANVGSRIRSFAVSPGFVTDGLLFVGAEGGIYKSTSGGSLQRVHSAPAAMLAISPDFAADRTVFAASGGSLYVSRDGGTGWAKLGGGPLSSPTIVEALAVSPNYRNDRTLFVSVLAKGLFKSADGGATFVAAGTSLYANNILVADYEWPTSAPIQLSPNYATDRTIFAFAANHVVRSTDRGSTWVVLDPPSASVLFQPPVIQAAPTTASIIEGGPGTTTQLGIAVDLSHPVRSQVRVQWTTVDGAGNPTVASSGTDYVAASGTLVFPPGSDRQFANVVVNGDDVDEGDESVVISLSGATNGTVGGYYGLGSGVVVDDDLPQEPSGSVSG